MCDVVTALSSYVVHVPTLTNFFDTIIRTLCDYEKTFPITEHAVIIHLLIHIYESILRFGPAYTFWMYTFERFVGSLSRNVKDRAHPEVNLINKHILRLSVRHVYQKYCTKLTTDVLVPFLPAPLFAPPPPSSSVRVLFPSLHQNKGVKRIHLTPALALLVQTTLGVQTSFVLHPPTTHQITTGVSIRGTPCGTWNKKRGWSCKTTTSLRYMHPSSEKVARVHSFISISCDELESMTAQLAFVYTYDLHTSPTTSMKYFNDAESSVLKCVFAAELGDPCAYVVLDQQHAPGICHVLKPRTSHEFD